MHSNEIRRYPVANGIFYPDNALKLKKQLDNWGLKKGEDANSSGYEFIIAPHGAWNLTGNTLSTAFSALQKESKNPSNPLSTVVLLGSHPNSLEEGIFLSESNFFETPLGQIAVDLKLSKKLVSCSTLIKMNDIPHLIDHSLEVLLPMVKYCFPDVKIIPILISGKKAALISALAGALKIVFNRKVKNSLFIVSSNVSQDKNPVLASFMAEEFTNLLEKMDSEAFNKCLTEGRISASGSVAVAALMESKLFEYRKLNPLSPIEKRKGETGDTVYFGAFCSTLAIQ